MKPESARALVWTTGILIVLGFIIMSPTGAFALFALAAICAAVPSAFGARRSRVISLLLLIAALALAVRTYPAFKRERETYMHRVRAR